MILITNKLLIFIILEHLNARTHLSSWITVKDYWIEIIFQKISLHAHFLNTISHLSTCISVLSKQLNWINLITIENLFITKKYACHSYTTDAFGGCILFQFKHNIRFLSSLISSKLFNIANTGNIKSAYPLRKKKDDNITRCRYINSYVNPDRIRFS